MGGSTITRKELYAPLDRSGELPRVSYVIDCNPTSRSLDASAPNGIEILLRFDRRELSYPPRVKLP
jgi:hypothetical protein